MGTNTSENINVKIIGNIKFNYTDDRYAPEAFRQELRLLVDRYGLDLEEVNNA